MEDHLVLARRKGETWYLAAMTDWTAREFVADLSFLPAGSYRLESIADGINAARHAQDHRFETQAVDAETHLTMKLAPGGGWAGIVSPDTQAGPDR